MKIKELKYSYGKNYMFIDLETIFKYKFGEKKNKFLQSIFKNYW